MKVFLGGTCNESSWREELEGLLSIAVKRFNPVVKDWDEAAQEREVIEHAACDYALYVLTPRMTGVYSIAEVVQDSNTRPSQTLLCILPHDGELRWTEGQRRSLHAVEQLCARNGAHVFDTLGSVAFYLNRKAFEGQPCSPQMRDL